ncbi:hypothetical protein [Bdellovibrio sp.]|uniref:hypothetical protein n=1 Tax=Bdellovibrio sp. TaxID=28201 RepID=UPI0039E6CA3A
MKNVSSKYLYVLIVFLTFLAGCKEPSLEVASLGKKLPSPFLKGADPFSQDFEAQNYVQIQGACDSRVGDILISFDKSIWHQPPTTPDLAGTTLPAATINDRDCTDGAFNLYLTKNDLTNIWGLPTGSSAPSVDHIYLKGESLIGDTETLVLSKGPNSGGGNSVATKLILEKNWPKGYAGSGQCESFRAQVQNSSGYRATTAVAITFKLEKRVKGLVSSDVATYSSWQDCQNGTTGQTTFTIPAGSDGIELIYKFPSTPLNETFEFRIVAPSSLSADSNYTPVVMRDSSAGSNYRWLTIEPYIHQIYKNTCYPVTIRSYNYNHSSPSDPSGGTINLTSSSSQMKFYTGSDCATETTSYTFSAYSSSINAFIKYTSSGSETETFTSVTLNKGAASAGSYTYDFAPFDLRIDLSNKSLATRLEFWGPQVLTRSQCQSFQLTTLNDNGTPIPVSAATQVYLGTQESSVGSFYTDSTCSYTSISSIAIPAQQSSFTVFFKATVNTAGTYHFLHSAAGLNFKSHDFNVILAPTKLKIYAPDMFAGACKAFTIGLSDDAGNSYVSTYNLNVNFNVSFSSPLTDRVFMDSNCSILNTSNNVTIGSGMGTAVVYIQTADLVGINLNMSVTSVGGLAGDYFYGTFH